MAATSRRLHVVDIKRFLPPELTTPMTPPSSPDHYKEEHHNTGRHFDNFHINNTDFHHHIPPDFYRNNADFYRNLRSSHYDLDLDDISEGGISKHGKEQSHRLHVYSDFVKHLSAVQSTDSHISAAYRPHNRCEGEQAVYNRFDNEPFVSASSPAIWNLAKCKECRDPGLTSASEADIRSEDTGNMAHSVMLHGRRISRSYDKPTGQDRQQEMTNQLTVSTDTFPIGSIGAEVRRLPRTKSFSTALPRIQTETCRLYNKSGPFTIQDLSERALTHNRPNVDHHNMPLSTRDIPRIGMSKNIVTIPTAEIVNKPPQERPPTRNKKVQQPTVKTELQIPKHNQIAPFHGRLQAKSAKHTVPSPPPLMKALKNQKYVISWLNSGADSSRFVQHLHLQSNSPVLK